MVSYAKQILDSSGFDKAVIGVIAFSGLLVGLETSPSFSQSYGLSLELLNGLIAGLFVAELLIRVLGSRPSPFTYFKDAWNIFDFFLIAACVVPLSEQYANIALLARTLRVLRLVTVLPRLNLLVTALIRTVPSIGYVTLLLTMHFYIYSVAGTFLFGANDPVHFGQLHLALISLFRVLTLEDWTDLMYIQMYGSDVYGYDHFKNVATEATAMPFISVAYFISFVLLGTMIILNLFVGVMLNSITQTSTEAEYKTLARQKNEGAISVADDLKLMSHHIEQLKTDIGIMSARLSDENGSPEREQHLPGRVVGHLRVINGCR